MKYLKSFSLYEVKSKKPNPNEVLIMDAIANTSAGKDLAALAKSYRVDRNGKLILDIRGKTCVKQNSDGRWEHWQEYGSRIYGRGEGATLEECLRSCWREFILNSRTFRPKDFFKNGDLSFLSPKDYADKVRPLLPSLEGKALNQEDLRFEILKIVKEEPNWDPIVDLNFIWDWPQLKEILDFIGLEIEKPGLMVGGWQHIRSTIAGKDDCPLNKILPDKSWFNVELIGREEEVFKVNSQGWTLQVIIGGDRSKEQDYKKQFMEALIAELKKDKEAYDFTTKTYSKESLPPKIILAGQLIEHGLKHDANIDDSLVIDTIASTAGNNVSVLAELPSPWRERVMQKKGYTDDEIKSISTSKELGLI